MSLLSPAELSNAEIEIESAHTPLGGFSKGSPTGEVSATPRRRQLERNHSGSCFVTLKRKGARDVVKQTHARSASIGSVGSGFGRSTPRADLACADFFPDGAGDEGAGDEGVGESGCCHEDVQEADGPLCVAIGPPSPPSFRRGSRSGGGSAGSRRGSRSRSGSRRAGSFRGSGDGGGSTVASLEDAAQRIAVDPDTGHSYFVERSTVCDACPFCDDTCEVAWCNGCDERRAHLEDVYGPLMLSAAEMEAAGAAGRAGRDASGAAELSPPPLGGESGGGSRLKLAPVLSRRYPRKSSFTPCEVRRRKVTGACWIVLQGSVYDVTAALADHPGGKRSVLRNAGGRDCAEDFFFHSRAAKKQWRRYRIGSLVPCRGEEGGGDGTERSMRTGSDCVIS